MGPQGEEEEGPDSSVDIRGRGQKRQGPGLIGAGNGVGTERGSGHLFMVDSAATLLCGLGMRRPSPEPWFSLYVDPPSAVSRLVRAAERLQARGGQRVSHSLWTWGRHLADPGLLL